MKVILSGAAALAANLLGLSGQALASCPTIPTLSGEPGGSQRAGEPKIFRPGETVCLLGNALAERMQHAGWLESRLQQRLPAHGLTFRNLGFGADEITIHQRTMNFGKFSADGMALNLPNERFLAWDRYLDHVDADLVLAFFGYNESFAGEQGLEAFRFQLEAFIDHVLGQHYRAEQTPRLVLFGSIPMESLPDPNLPDSSEVNRRIELYNASMREVADARGVRFVDLYAPMRMRYRASAEALTINGIHLTDRGNEVLAEVIEAALLPQTDSAIVVREDLRALVRAKNALWFERYRVTDGYNVYGDRSRLVYRGVEGEKLYSNFDVLQRELDHIDVQVKNRDRAIQALARGESLVVDDSNAPPLIEVPTNKPGEGDAGLHRFLYGQGNLKGMTAAPGMQVELFADERQFPELVNPVQMAWDTRGRLWVATWASYPHRRPDQAFSDKLLILEDEDGDGRADRSIVFADGLHNPTGFEFWNGGVLLAAVPDLLFLEDTDGDDRADVSERLLHGLSSADTHHSANSFVLGPDGALYFQEGTFHRSQVETIYGPVRNNGGCVWRYEPRTRLVERYIPYGFANPHGHVFDRWGQDFMTDGTGNVNYYALPFSGFLTGSDRHERYFPFFQQRSRPAGGTEILSSAHFPEENQGNYLIANVIGFRGVFQYEVRDDGSGFQAHEVAPILESSDLNFRPVDLEVGPDGALYVLDWHNPIIGHMQHHLRDPSRDAKHGRIYRVTYAGRDLLRPRPIAGQPVAELLELLASDQDRTRYRARIELSGRDSEEVLAAARAWTAGLDPAHPDHEHRLLEALWLHQQHNRVDRSLLVQLLSARDPRARAAATRVVRGMRHQVPDALNLLLAQAKDPHPRVRLEAVVAASYFATAGDTQAAQAATVALECLRQPSDRFLDYALGETLRALDSGWKAALRAGEPVAEGNPAGIEYLLGRVTPEELQHLPRIPAVLRALATGHGLERGTRIDALAELAALAGTSRTEQALAAIGTVDAGSQLHATHVLHELAGILSDFADSGDPEERPARAALVALAEGARMSATRSLAYAALIERDGDIQTVWESAQGLTPRLLALLEAIPAIRNPELRDAFGDRVRPLMFAPPSGLRAAQQGGAGSGLEVSFFEPAPVDAERSTLERLRARERFSASHFTLDLPEIGASDSFGLRFEGLLFVPSAGRYTFSTNSDDGSRLYVGDECVVNNDGDHGMVLESGSIELMAGPQRIGVTYFESGGGEGLEVTWSGPGIERQPIPASALGRDSALTLRAAAIRAMAHVSGRADEKLADAARLLGDDLLLQAVIELVGSVPDARISSEGARRLLDTLTAYIAGVPAEQRTLPDVLAALAEGRRLTGALPDEEAHRALERLDGFGGTSLLLRTLPHQMRYDLGEFWVAAGRPVSLVFQNNDVMPHNLVITQPGAMAEVGRAAERLSLAPAAQANEFIPEMDAVLWHTRLLMPGQSERLAFVAPKTPGDHPFVCTYPGHWRVMNGVMHVVEQITADERVTRRKKDDGAIARAFVRDWVLADVAPRLEQDWLAGASIERGRTLFEEAGCIKCHALPSSAAASPGPDLSQIQEKFSGLELLRHILEPSLEVEEQYRVHVFELRGGTSVVGRILAEDGETLHILPDLLEPTRVTALSRDEIDESWDSRLSPMPTGLLVTFTQEEILDLLCFLQDRKDH